MRDLRLIQTNPVAFFELSDGYDRRDLKRAYGKAIRQYRPETHPAEFQLIREAYEDLERALRYGQDRKQQQQAAQAWDMSSTAPKDTAPQPTPSTAQPKAKRRASTLSFRELATVDPKLALKKFKTMKRRTAQDYYAAAVLSDAVAGKSTQTYLIMLLDGFAAYPSDPGLHQLICEYVRNETPDTLIEKTLKFIAEKINDPSFYSLSEPLWIRLLGRPQADFESFQSLLSSCERKIKQTDLRARDAFYLRIVRLAVWVAPPQWTTNVLQELESRSASMDYESQSDLDFAAEIQGILGVNDKLKKNTPVRDRLLLALRLSCSESIHQSLRRILALLNESTQDTKAFQQSFPIDQSQDDEVWISAIYRLTVQVHPFVVDSEDQVSQQRQIDQTVELVNDLSEDAMKIFAAIKAGETRYRTLPFLLWIIGGTIGLALPIVVGLMLISTGAVSSVIAIVVLIALIIGLVVSFARWLSPKFLAPRLAELRNRRSKAAYQEHWRSRLFRFSRSSSETLDSSLAKIQFITDQRSNDELGKTIRFFTFQDTGLQIFSILQLVRS